MTHTSSKYHNYYKVNKAVILHTLISAAVFYFIIHPLTMAMYWFEFNENHQANLSVADIIIKRWFHSFSFHMTGMSGIFLLIGTTTGFGFGIYFKNMQKKNRLLLKQEQFLNLNIEQTIQQGENEYTEFKSSLRYDYAKKNTNKELEIVIAKTIAGLMNANGGKLIIGIADNGEILGLENDYFTFKHKNRDGFERRLYEIISQYLGAEFCSHAHIYFYRKADKDFCAIEIVKSPTPVYVNSDKDSTFYLRTGNATTALTVKEAVSYIKLNKLK
ncbi:MAG: ATP-binding protein [Sphingobacteriales bacterium]|nr:ATP-binding protein [Sphingobacteriales bacterium]